MFHIYVVTCLIGNGAQQFSGDGGPGHLASLNSPYFVAVDAAYNVFISDFSNHRVRVVMSNSGNISTIAGTGEVKLGL